MLEEGIRRNRESQGRWIEYWKKIGGDENRDENREMDWMFVYMAWGY